MEAIGYLVLGCPTVGITISIVFFAVCLYSIIQDFLPVRDFVLIAQQCLTAAYDLF